MLIIITAVKSVVPQTPYVVDGEGHGAISAHQQEREDLCSFEGAMCPLPGEQVCVDGHLYRVFSREFEVRTGRIPATTAGLHVRVLAHHMGIR